ncbi:glycosyltransferase [Sphingomonas sp. MMS24-J13]|uniref:glycosyltransferase family protein n=1 Tax=Sphingomonas sp. MMS24-J13 TaxID=3238686 RepID=UPI00384E4A42
MDDHYSARFHLENPPRTWTIPPEIIPKLTLGPAFHTAPNLIALFEGELPPETQRDIDLHARIATGGTPWYSAMRQELKAAVSDHFGDLTVASEGRVSYVEFMRELGRSKLCFSPFGYGEVCWRDFEAIAAGSVLIKQDMGMVAADPDIYRADETYVPVAWDFSDLDAKVRALLADPARRRRIAERAFAVVRDHLRGPALEQLIARLT